MQPAGHSNVAAANAVYRAVFQEFFGRGIPGMWQLFTQDVPVAGDALSSPIATSIPVVQEWIGDKTFETLREFMQTTPVKSYQTSLRLKALLVDSDQTGNIDNQIRTFLGRQVQAMDKLVVERFLANPTGYDGVALLADSHPYSNGTGDNLTTDALSFPSVDAMDEQMQQFEDEEGENWDITPNTLLVGPENERTALQISGADRPIYFDNTGSEATANVVDGVVIENVRRGRYDVVVSRRIKGQQWFLIDTRTPGAKPMLTATFQTFTPETQIARDDFGRFMRDEYLFSLEGKLGINAGLWQSVGGRIAS